MNKKFYSGIIPFLFLLFIVQTTSGQNVGINNVTPFSTLDVSGSFGNGIRAVTLSATIAADDATVLATPGIVLTLPSSSLSKRRVILIVFNGSSGASAVTIKPAGTDNVISNNITYSSASGILLNAGSMTLQTDGSGKWYSTVNTSAQGGTNWLVTGNAGTVDGTNFLGTTDNVPLTFRVNNQIAGRIDNAKYNAFYGFLAGNGNSTGYDNTFAGDSAGYSNTTGYTNSAFGMTALYSNTTGFRNLAFGYKSLFANTTGNVNVAFGNKTMMANTTGGDNSAFGNASLLANTTGNNNAAFGNYASLANVTGSDNTSIGYATLYSNTAGSTNTALGYQAMYTGVTGSSNTAIGTAALYSITSSFNSALGNYAGSNSTSGGYNVFVGNTAGSVNTTGSNNIFLGAGADATPGSVALTNAAAIGYSALVGASNSIVLGGTGANAVNVGIGIAVPTTTLQVNGTASLGKASATTGILSFLNSTNANTVGVLPGITSASYTLTLPTAIGAANQALTITGIVGSTATLGWATQVASGTDWLLAGNAGTTSANFLGTTDNVGLSFRTNNIQSMHIDSLGHVGIGTTQFDALDPQKFLVDYGVTTSNNVAGFHGSIDDELSLEVKNRSSGNNATSIIKCISNNGSDSTNNLEMGIHSSTYVPSFGDFGGADDGFIYAHGRHLVIGTTGLNTDLVLLTGGGTINASTDLRIIGSTGNVVIGAGEGTAATAGNTIRGPNGAAGNNAGGSLTIQGGAATGSATGGTVIINGGASATGTIGAVKINGSANFPTNINTGTSNQNVTIGGSNNNILFPQLSTVGGMFYTSAGTGQISETTQMIWDNTNTRLGIGIAVPTTTLQVNGIASLGKASATTGILSLLNSTNANTVGVQPGITSASYTLTLPTAIGAANQALTITGIVGANATLGWTSPNAGTITGSGTATQVAFWSAGTALTSSANLFWDNTNNRLGIGIAVPTTTLQVNGTASLGSATATTGILSFLNSTNAFTVGVQPGITSASYTLTLPTAIGAANQALTITGIVGSTATLGWTTPIGSGTAWLLTGNGGTTAGTNFIGTTDAVDFVTKTAGTERMRVLGVAGATQGFIGINTNAPSTLFDVEGGAGTTTQTAATIAANSLTSGKALLVSSTSTAGAAAGSSFLISLTRSGINTNATHSAYGINASVTNTGTTSTNIAAQFSASGATNNYGIVVPTGGGFVGIGTITPITLFDVEGGASTTTQTAATIAANSLTTGTALSVSSTGVIASGGNAESVTANSATTGNILNISGTGLTTGSLLNATAGTTTGNAVGITANGISTGAGINLTSNGLTSGKALSISSTSTAGSGAGSSYLINLSRSGINANASHTAYGINATVTNSGTTNTNIAAQFSASGATNNYGIIVPSGGGSVGIGTAAPGALLDVNGTFRLGSNATSTVLNNVIKTSFSAILGTLAPITTAIYTVTVTGATTNASVIINPRVNLVDGVAILWVRASAANTVVFELMNSGSLSAVLGTVTFDVTVIQ